MANSSTKTNNISKGEMRHFIAEAVREALTDPDFGLELTSGIIKDLKESIKQKKEGKVVSLEEILRGNNKK